MKRNAEMHKSNLTHLELEAAHKNELQHLIAIKEKWLNAYDRDDLYCLRDSYEDTLGFSNGGALDAWEKATLESLKSKPAEMGAINYLKSLGDTTLFDTVLYTRLLRTERIYLIRKNFSEVTVRICNTEDVFIFDITLPETTHHIVFEYETQMLQLSRDALPTLQIHCSSKEYDLFEAVFEGVAHLYIDKNILVELERVFHSYAQEVNLSLDAFQPFAKSDGGLK
jgi:hypothetical protein